MVHIPVVEKEISSGLNCDLMSAFELIHRIGAITWLKLQLKTMYTDVCKWDVCKRGCAGHCDTDFFTPPHKATFSSCPLKAKAHEETLMLECIV